MRKTILLYTFVVIGLHSLAQVVEWGNQQKFKNKTNYSQVLGENASGIFVARSRSTDFRYEVTVEKYKANLTLEYSKELPKQLSTRTERVIITDDGVVEFFTLKANNKLELKAQFFDNSLNSTQLISLFSVDNNQLLDDAKFFIKSTQDKKGYSVLFLTSGLDKQKSVLNIHGFEATLAQKYSRRFSMQAPAEDIFISNMECDNQGNVFAVIDMPKKSQKKARDFFVYSYFPASDNMLEYPLQKDSSFITEVGLVVNNYTKSVAVAGFYSDKPDNKCLGQFFYNIDVATNKVVAQTYEPFDISFVSKALSSLQEREGAVLTDLVIRKLIPNSNGGCTILAEKFYETKQSYTYQINGFPQTSYRSVYNYDEIIVIAKNGDGTTKFKQVIKKSQPSVSDGGYYSSFITVLTNEKIGIIYNSDIANEGDILMATINNKGELDSRVLIKSVSYFVLLMPSESKQVSANTAVITALKDRRFCLMRLTF
ncbi:MAG: hypothetical protein EAY81_03105 [Bacteroidetes bacterium]|nr:MAG: hypothetical protein EAY81_03105 [Bacteroidota bacterium]